ncbi:hypothetical protein BDZ91DRAFT_848377 [Kalaharituber pfeilii]|nr:hypothetical protein BDZ91DRAFT_848377 [Kalaharituber pfeilii]
MLPASSIASTAASLPASAPTSSPSPGSAATVAPLRQSLAPNGAGTGLFTTRSFMPGEVVLHIAEPLVAVPDEKHIRECCSGCLKWKPGDKEGGNGDGGRQLKYPDPEEQEERLMKCTGCNIVRYCGKTCQKYDWRRAHRHECPVFAKLQPRVLPASVRACIRLLLLRKYGELKGESGNTVWRGILRLRGHEEGHVESEKKREMIPLMAKAAQTYSGTAESEELVRGLYCKTLVNTFSIAAPNGTETIGNLFDPYAALFNHSCEPNCTLEFSGKEVFVVALRDVKEGEEARIAYVDVEGVDVEKRRKELAERWFFDCECGRCKTEMRKKGGGGGGWGA